MGDKPIKEPDTVADIPDYAMRVRSEVVQLHGKGEIGEAYSLAEKALKVIGDIDPEWDGNDE